MAFYTLSLPYYHLQRLYDPPECPPSPSSLRTTNSASPPLQACLLPLPHSSVAASVSIQATQTLRRLGNKPFHGQSLRSADG
ncbi:hypothetical protein C8R44DRAFT_809253 [Mycena epipterygia]|nr:hypothetical protein C8R44DRAFT_809253 [Mycena epipterygia]